MPRTDPGEGSVYQRRDGRWVAVLRWDQPDGTQKRIPCYGATRAQALAARRERRQTEAARVARQQTPTVAEWLADWQAAQAGRWAAKTRRTYAGHVRLHIVPHLGTVRLGDLTPGAVEAWQTTLIAAGVPLSQRHNAWGVLRAALAAAERAELVPRNVVPLTHRPPKPPPRRACLSAAEAGAVLAAATGTRWELLLRLAVHTGMRQGELLGLRWSAVDWDRGTLTIDAALLGGNLAGYRLAPPKTPGSVRTLPLPAPLLAALAAHRTARADVPPGPIPDLVFTTDTGTPISPRNLYRAWQRYCRAAVVPTLAFHSLRHTAATLLLDSGLALPVVLAWFGWTNAAMLTRVYAHPRPADLAAVGEALATRLLHPAPGTKKDAIASVLSPCGPPGKGRRLWPHSDTKTGTKWAKKPLKTPDV